MSASRARWSALLAGGVLGLGMFVIVRFARALVTPPRRQRYPIRIEGIDRAREQIVLTDTPETRSPGRVGLWFGSDAGYVRLGEIEHRGGGRVVRRIEQLVSGHPRRGQQARESGWFYLGPWELGLEYESVEIETELGPSAAWLVDASDATRPGDWMIHIHGRTALRAETLRSVRIAAAHGWRSLVVSYRNDPLAPKSPDGRYGLGMSEADDVLSALEFAAAHGAQRVVLCGWSMGGTIALQGALRASERPELPAVVGIILESPALDWRQIVRHHARLVHLPELAGASVTWLLNSRLAPVLTGVTAPIPFDRLDGGRLIRELGLPVLLLHSAADDYVPVDASRQAASASPELVSYVEFQDAGHVRLWNRYPDRWEAAVGEWLDRFEPASLG